MALPGGGKTKRYLDQAGIDFGFTEKELVAEAGRNTSRIDSDEDGENEQDEEKNGSQGKPDN